MDDLFDVLQQEGLWPSPPPAAPEPLLDYLSRHFPLRDRRWKTAGLGRPFKIDDRDKADHYRGSWSISATVPGSDAVVLLEIEDCPHDPSVQTVISRCDPTHPALAPSGRVSLLIRPNKDAALTELARAVRQVPCGRRRYSNPNWAWMAPRTADALDRLARILSAYRPLTAGT